MIGLTFDGNLLTAATLTDGGEIFAHAEQPAPGNDYREWLLSVAALAEQLAALEVANEARGTLEAELQQANERAASAEAVVRDLKSEKCEKCAAAEKRVEALRAERHCEKLFHVFNPSTPGDAFAVSPEGTPRFSQGGGIRHVASRPALVDLEARGVIRAERRNE